MILLHFLSLATLFSKEHKKRRPWWVSFLVSQARRFRSSPMDIRECELPQGDEVTETGRVIGVEFKVEFGPIEHPLEPTDEDHPVKCPMSNSSVLSDGERPKEQTAESVRKIAEFTVADDEGMVAGLQPLAHPVRKRHQTLHRDRGRPPLSMVPQRSVLQMFAELNEFEP